MEYAPRRRGGRPLRGKSDKGGVSLRNFLIKRILYSIIILFFVTLIIYTLIRCLPTSYVETLAVK